MLNKHNLDKAVQHIHTMYDVPDNTKLLTNTVTFYSGYFREENFDYFKVVIPIFRLIINLNMSLPLRLRLTKLYDKDKDMYCFLCIFTLNSTLDNYEFLLTSNCGDPDKNNYLPILYSTLAGLEIETKFPVNTSIVMEVSKLVNKWDFYYYIKLPITARKHLLFPDVYRKDKV